MAATVADMAVTEDLPAPALDNPIVRQAHCPEIKFQHDLHIPVAHREILPEQEAERLQAVNVQVRHRRQEALLPVALQQAAPLPANAQQADPILAQLEQLQEPAVRAVEVHQQRVLTALQHEITRLTVIRVKILPAAPVLLGLHNRHVLTLLQGVQHDKELELRLNAVPHAAEVLHLQDVLTVRAEAVEQTALHRRVAQEVIRRAEVQDHAVTRRAEAVRDHLARAEAPDPEVSVLLQGHQAAVREAEVQEVEEDKNETHTFPDAHCF